MNVGLVGILAVRGTRHQRGTGLCRTQRRGARHVTRWTEADASAGAGGDGKGVVGCALGVGWALAALEVVGGRAVVAHQVRFGGGEGGELGVGGFGMGVA